MNTKLLFCYGDIIIELPSSDWSTSCELVPYSFDKGFIKWKANNERELEVACAEMLEIPQGQKGDLYIYDTEDSGSIWQMVYNGIGRLTLHSPSTFHNRLRLTNP